MELYAGIDLHSSNSVLAVIDASGAQLRSKRLANDLPAILAELEPYRADLVGVAVESTYNWYWLVDGLMDHGHRVRLVNTAAIPQYDGLKHGDDRTDARHLAELMRLGLLPEGYIYPRPARATRDLLRRRAALVRQSTQVILSMQSTYARITGRPISGQDLLKLKPEALMSALSDPTVCCGVLAQLRVWQVMREQIHRIEGWVRQDIHPKSDLARLQSTPGIGSILGMTILLETGDINRFGSVGEYASYCRMVESVRLSNGKRKGRGNAKCGNRYLCWAFIEAANFAIRYSEPIRRWYDRKHAKRHRVVALKAVAHKLARAVFHMLRDDQPFKLDRAFG
jgi:transposase